MYKNILQYIEQHAAATPENIAVNDSETGYSYSELMAKAKSVGSFLLHSLDTSKSATDKHRAVFVYMNKTAHNLVALMGVVYSAHPYIPIDPLMPTERINKIIDTVNPICIIYDSKTSKNLDSLNTDCKKVSFEEASAYTIDEAGLLQIRTKSIDTDPLYMLFTSGSTGIPKGVVVCHRSVIDYAEWLCDEFGFDQNTVFGNQTPFYFSMSVLDIYATIACGGTLSIIPKKYFGFPARLIEYLNEKKVNTIYWVPSALSIVANIGILDLTKPEYLTKILFAGEVMPTKQLNIWRKALPDALYANLFGPTEITDIGVYYVLNREFRDDEPIPIGTACDNVDLLVIDENGNSIDNSMPDTIGELYIRGSFLAFGYYNNPDKTSEAFVQNPLNNAYPEIVYKTGDLVYYNSLGELVYKSRKDFQIKHMGNRIELGEIEVSLSSLDGIASCCCLYDKEDDIIIGVFTGDAKEDTIRQEMAKRVPKYMRPDKYINLPKMPLNSNGKIDRVKLNAEYATKQG